MPQTREGCAQSAFTLRKVSLPTKNLLHSFIEQAFGEHLLCVSHFLDPGDTVKKDQVPAFREFTFYCRRQTIK